MLEEVINILRKHAGKNDSVAARHELDVFFNGQRGNEDVRKAHKSLKLLKEVVGLSGEQEIVHASLNSIFTVPTVPDSITESGMKDAVQNMPVRKRESVWTERLSKNDISKVLKAMDTVKRMGLLSGTQEVEERVIQIALNKKE